MNGTLTFDYNKIERAALLLNHIQVTGVGQARILAELGSILEDGKPYAPGNEEAGTARASVGCENTMETDGEMEKGKK